MREPTRIAHFQITSLDLSVGDRARLRASSSLVMSKQSRYLTKERGMSKKQKRIFWPVVLVVALALGALAFASGRDARRTIEAPSLASQNPIGVANSSSEEYVRGSRLWPQLRWN